MIGSARFRDGKTIEVGTHAGPQVIHAEAVVIATGSEASHCHSFLSVAP